MLPPYCCRVPRSRPRSRPLNLLAARLVPSLNYAVSQMEQELGVPLFESRAQRAADPLWPPVFADCPKLAGYTGCRGALGAGIRPGRRAGAAGQHPHLGHHPGARPDAGFLHTTGCRRPVPAAQRNRVQRRPAQSRGGRTAGFAFTSHPGDPAKFETVAFRRTPFVVITPHGHPLTAQHSIALQDTLPYPQVCFASCSGLCKSVDALFCAINAAPDIVMETEEDAVIAGLVAAGFGIAVLPDDPLFQSLPFGRAASDRAGPQPHGLPFPQAQHAPARHGGSVSGSSASSSCKGNDNSFTCSVY